MLHSVFYSTVFYGLLTMICQCFFRLHVSFLTRRYHTNQIKSILLISNPIRTRLYRAWDTPTSSWITWGKVSQYTISMHCWISPTSHHREHDDLRPKRCSWDEPLQRPYCLQQTWGVVEFCPLHQLPPKLQWVWIRTEYNKTKQGRAEQMVL